jgi:MOSC domain-containing protein YiiM
MLMEDGRVHAINVSDGGIPKTSRNSAWVDAEGVEGDRQRNLTFHGGPNRAVSLYSLDRIRALQAEGHPIAPGTIGENLTIEGVDWSLMVPGVRVQVGEVELELTAYATPCRNIAPSFSDGNSARVAQKRHPGWSRVYAKVLHEGRIVPGDSVLIAPV